MNLHRPATAFITSFALAQVLLGGFFLQGAAAAPAPASTASGTVAGTASGTVAGMPALPADVRQRLERAAAHADSSVTALRAALQARAAGDPQPCASTPLEAWIAGQVSQLSEEEAIVLLFSGALFYADVDAQVYGTPNDPVYTLATPYRGRIDHAMSKGASFWGAPATGVPYFGYSGTIITDEARVVRLLTQQVGFPRELAVELAAFLHTWVGQHPVLQGGHWPLLSFNAFAVTDQPGDERIAVGEGVVRAVEALGYSAVGPQTVVAHELGHVLQMRSPVLRSQLEAASSTAAGSRRLELMADALAAYLDTHQRGLNLNARKVEQAIGTSWLVGDCMTDMPGHHGTPDQRARAAAWGAQLAVSEGGLRGVEVFAARFDAALPGILLG